MKSANFVLLVLLAAIMWLPCAAAQKSPSPVAMTLAEIESAAMRGNPEIKAAVHRAAAAERGVRRHGPRSSGAAILRVLRPHPRGTFATDRWVKSRSGTPSDRPGVGVSR